MPQPQRKIEEYIFDSHKEIHNICIVCMCIVYVYVCCVYTNTKQPLSRDAVVAIMCTTCCA